MIKTVRGVIAVDYRVGEHFEMQIPPGTSAEVHVPGPDGEWTVHRLGGGYYRL